MTAVTAAPLLDTHCHLDAYDNPILVLDQARAAGVHVVAVTEDPGRYRLLRTRLGRRAGVEVALGLHPLRVAGASMAEVARFRRLLREAIWVGEVGLDFSRAGAATRSQQLRTFDALLAEVRAGSWPVSVHSRGAEREAVDRLVDARVRAILHWYTGPLAVAEDALAGGLWFSINPAMAASMRSRALLAHLPPAGWCLKQMDHLPGAAAAPPGPPTWFRWCSGSPTCGRCPSRRREQLSSTTSCGCWLSLILHARLKGSRADRIGLVKRSVTQRPSRWRIHWH